MRGRIGLLALGLTACSVSEGSVSIIFPNEVARSAVRRLRVESYKPEAGGGPASERDCDDFLGKARVGDDPLGTPVRADYQCVPSAQNDCASGWFDGRADLRMPRGRRIIYILAFASTDEGATPILEGCSDQFDSEGSGDEANDVPITLSLVIPDNARMTKSAGDRQIGRPGEEVLVPLEVRVQADSPDGTGGTYDIPGVPIRFSSERAGFDLVGDGSATTVDTFTSLRGRASVGVRLPAAADTGEIVATAEALRVEDGMNRHQQTFTLSVTAPAVFVAKDVLGVGDGTIPIAAAIGDLDQNALPDLAVVACEGARANCTPGLDAVLPVGSTRLSVFTNVGDAASRRLLNAPADLGGLPADILIDDVAPAPGTSEIVLLNSRRAACTNRVCPASGPCPCYGREPGEPCPCEGAEILILEPSGDDVVLSSRHTMTGSNAIALTTFESSSDRYRGIAMAAQGRSINERPCSPTPRCLPSHGERCEGEPELCGCPPAERCECDGCSGPNQVGVCMARDKIVDVLAIRTLSQVDELYNRNGCQEPSLFCDNQNPETSTCSCADEGNATNNCTATDGCGCRVPANVYIGALDAPVLPFSLSAGPLRDGTTWDLVAPSVGGLELIEARGASFEWRSEPIVNAPIHDLDVVDLDLAFERRTLAPERPDVVWSSREPCLAGNNFQSSCAVWRPLDEGTEELGCLGAYFTAGQSSIFNLRTPTAGGCRRHPLAFRPHGMCTGDFNGDGHVDVALASRDEGDVFVYSGDGQGGLLDPPIVEALPGDSGGPLACADLDGDGLTDIVALNGNTGAIYLLRTSN